MGLPAHGYYESRDVNANVSTGIFTHVVTKSRLNVGGHLTCPFAEKRLWAHGYDESSDVKANVSTGIFGHVVTKSRLNVGGHLTCPFAEKRLWACQRMSTTKAEMSMQM